MRLEPLPRGIAPPLTDEAAAPPAGLAEKAELRDELARLLARLAQLQNALRAEAKRALLVILQARDAGGKDGTVRHVFGGLDPMALQVTAFTVPTPLELAHDFLWRVHRAVPPKGTIGVFNRSHYEDVLAVRVHRLAPEAVWRARFEQINAFERILVENEVVILKFYLHVSREEQRRRLLQRLKDPEKNWKFDARDLKERDLWDDYTAAYRDVLILTNTAWAPWYLVPGDSKPIRDLLVAETVLETLVRMDPQYPKPRPEAEELRKRLEGE